MNEATDPEAAKEELVNNYGFLEADVVAGGDFITVYGDPEANHPLGGVLYAVNDIGWRAFSVEADPDGDAPYVTAERVQPTDAPGWMRLTSDRVVRRGDD